MKVLTIIITLTSLASVAQAGLIKANNSEQPCSSSYLGPKVCVLSSDQSNPQYLALKQAINLRVDEIVRQSSLPNSNLLQWHKTGINVVLVSQIFHRDDKLKSLKQGLFKLQN